MKKLVFLWLLGCNSEVWGQEVDPMIPAQAVTVFSINNTDLLQKISIDEWITYDFMEEIHQELFDKSTENKTVKDAGLDFDQRLSLFYGKTPYYEVTGFTFGIKDQKALFNVFDDFENIPSAYQGVQIYHRYSTTYSSTRTKAYSSVLNLSKHF